jgi:hypothetical protein
LANTHEVLYIQNRSGNRPSHEHSGFYFDLAIGQCQEAGFKKIRLRGDTDFSVTRNFDRWDDQSIEFVFGYDAKPNLKDIAESLENEQWKPLRRRNGQPPKTGRRAKPENIKEQIVVANEYENKQLIEEHIAEFDYQPTDCDRSYRMIVVRKKIETKRGQQRLFEEFVYFFYVTNTPPTECSARQVVFQANDRCNQENDISQLHDCGALAAPLNNLLSNWAYMVIASLAWTLKCWSGLMVCPEGPAAQRQKQIEDKHRVVTMEFQTFLQTIINIPAQIIRTSRRLIYRLLSFRQSVETLLLIYDNVSRPLRC